MHSIDHNYRSYKNSRNYDLLCHRVHDVAERLEKLGYETYGLNEELYIKLHISEKETLYLYIHCTSEKDTIQVEDQHLSIRIPTTIDDFPKLFNKESYLVKGIREYRQALRQFRLSMSSNLDMAIKMDKI